MSTSSARWSRRDFLKGSLALAGGAAALGLAGNALAAGAASSKADAKGASPAADAPTEGAWSFKDQADYDVTVQIPVARMVVLQHHSLDMLCQLGQQDKVVGIESKWKSDLGDYMLDVFPGIDQLPTPGNLSDSIVLNYLIICTI